MNVMTRCVAAGLASVVLAAAAADDGKTLRQADLREKPFNDAPVVTVLPASAPLTVISRKGSWAQIKAGGKQGWIKVLNIITQSGRSSNTSLVSAGKVLTTGASGRDSSTAVKGVSEESLKKADPAPAEVDWLDTLGRTDAEAITYARKAGLKEQTIPWLPTDKER